MVDNFYSQGYCIMYTDARYCIRSATTGLACRADRVLALAREFPLVRPSDSRKVPAAPDSRHRTGAPLPW